MACCSVLHSSQPTLSVGPLMHTTPPLASTAALVICFWCKATAVCVRYTCAPLSKSSCRMSLSVRLPSSSRAYLWNAVKASKLSRGQLNHVLQPRCGIDIVMHVGTYKEPLVS